MEAFGCLGSVQSVVGHGAVAVERTDRLEQVERGLWSALAVPLGLMAPRHDRSGRGDEDAPVAACDDATRAGGQGEGRPVPRVDAALDPVA